MAENLVLPTLLVDSRESRSDVPTWLTRLGYATESTELQVGDYHAPGLILVERKVASDFVLSLMDGRLFGQAELLANHEDLSLLIIEGRLDTVRSAVEPEAIAGALSALAMYYDLKVLTTVGPEMTARVIGRVVMNRTNGLGYDIGSRVLKPKLDGAMSEYLLQGLPGIGPQMARRLLGVFGSAAAVFAASETQLQTVKGLGAKMAAQIVSALHHKPTNFRDTKGPAPGRAR